MTTPEGQTKNRLRKLLAEYAGMYTYWPVPSGFGRRTVDVLGCYRGRFFAVETKADGKKPTLLQARELETVELAMGRTFVMAGPQDPVFDDLAAWLDDLTRTVDNDPILTTDLVKRRAI